jgi:hypothetical protein
VKFAKIKNVSKIGLPGMESIQCLKGQGRAEGGDPSKPCKQYCTGIPAYSTATITLSLSLCFYFSKFIYMI